MKGLDHTYAEEGSLWEHLIRGVVTSMVNTAVPAEVVDISKDKKKVAVRALVIPKESTEPPVVYNNALVGHIGGGKLKIHFPLNKGDQGLLITSKHDLIEFKKTLKSSKTHTGRVFDSNDSIFIPLVFNTADLSKEDVVIVHNEEAGDDASKVTINSEGIEVRSKENISIKTGQARFSFHGRKALLHTQDGEIEVVASQVNIDCQSLKCPPLKQVVDALRDLMDDLAKGMKGGGTNDLVYKASKPLKEPTFRLIQD